MQMVILCGGLATRLGSLSKHTPKSMIDINGKPFLWHQINNLKKYDIRDIILCVGYLSEEIEKYFGEGSEFSVNIKYSYDGDKLLGPIGALKNAEQLLDEEFFIMYGDSYLSVDFNKVYNFYKQKKKPACMVVYKNMDKYDKSNLIVKNDMVVGYGEKDRSKEMIYIDYGTSIISKKTLNYVPEKKLFSTGDFFSKLIENKDLVAYQADKRFYHIGNPKALEEFRSFINS